MTTATSTAQALDEASQALSDVAYNFQQAEAEIMSLWLNEDDPCPQTIANFVIHLETVQAGISKALAAAKTAQAQLGED